MIDHNHPAVEALADAIYWALSGQYGDFGTPSKGEAHAALTAALPHLTADDLRDTPAGQALIREGIAAARNLEWMQPRMTPGGHIFNPAIPGDELRAFREEALAREAMQNMRESEQGRELMAEGWDQGWRDRRQYDQDIDWRTIPITDTNPYREGDA